MGKKYYCDYCDKSFPDSVHGRKKHNDGQSHLQLKRMHFNAFKDARTRLNEELAKELCRRYQRTQQCQFGENCRYSHVTPHDIAQLQQRVILEEASSVKLPSQLTASKPPPSDGEFRDLLEELLSRKLISNATED